MHSSHRSRDRRRGRDRDRRDRKDRRDRDRTRRSRRSRSRSGSRSRRSSGAKCYECGEYGHISRRCPDRRRSKSHSETSDSEDERERKRRKARREREAQNQGMWDQIPLGATATNTAFNPLHQIQLAVAGSGDRKSRRLYVGICCLHILSYFLIARFAFIYFTMLPFVIDFRDGLFC